MDTIKLSLESQQGKHCVFKIVIMYNLYITEFSLYKIE